MADGDAVPTCDAFGAEPGIAEVGQYMDADTVGEVTGDGGSLGGGVGESRQ